MIRSRHAWAAAAFLLCLVASGRDSAAQSTSPVRGHIRFEGKPVAAGRIIFYLLDDEFVGAKIKNGDYKLKYVPPGTWQVAIESEEVPEKYRGEETSGLRVQLKARV